MGAGCSVAVRQRYKLIKDYLHSKECMTFDVAEGFLPHAESNRPPVILMGENHTRNDSDVAKLKRPQFSPEEFTRKTSCVTAIRAVSDIVSKCSSPGAKVYVLLEDHPKIFPEINEPDKTVQFSSQNQTRFGLENLINVSNLHSRLYDKGIEIIPFDMFYELRGLFLHENHVIKNRLKENNFFHKTSMHYMITILERSIKSMGDTTFNVEGAFEECYKRETLEVPKYRSRIQNYFDNETRVWGRIRRQDERDMIQTKLSQFKRDYLQENADGGAAVGEGITEQSIEMTQRDHNYNFALFRMAYWVYCFTQFTIKSVDQSSALDDDIRFASNLLEALMTRVIEEPVLWNMFQLITLCGDFITYMMYLRKRVIEQNKASLFVIYAGSAHTDRFDMLLSRISTHKKDFTKISDRVCEDQGERGVLAHKCSHSRLLDVDELVSHMMSTYAVKHQPGEQPWFMSEMG